MAALIAGIVAGAEALKIIAGFAQPPGGLQLWSLGAVTMLSALLGWLNPPQVDLLAKKNVSGLSI